MVKANLVLEDGTVFEGKIFGEREVIGEVIFNTAVVGYQQVTTDPSNAGKIIVFTYPLIGNYGVNPKFNESEKVWCEGIIMKEMSRIYSNWQATESLVSFLEKNKTVFLTDVDTRTLMVHLREKGEMFGIISSDKNFGELLEKIKNFKNKKSSFLEKISIKEKKFLRKRKTKLRIGILDLGITRSILSQWERLGVSLVLLPYNTSSQEIVDLKLKGLVISNGPEEDLGLEKVVENVRTLLGRIPILGISTGFYILAKVLDIKLQKMKIGHRGLNYPVMREGSYKGEITVQNHGYTLERKSLEKRKEIKITSYNLNDKTIEEIESKKLKLLGIQYYPVSPGFEEINPIFLKFLNLI